jgi:hypothetical protein
MVRIGKISTCTYTEISKMNNILYIFITAARTQMLLPPSPIVDVLHNEPLSVVCEVRGRPAASISWTYEGRNTLPNGVIMHPNLIKSDGKYSITRGLLLWDIDLSSVDKLNSSGQYTCHGSNGVGDILSANSVVAVLCA